MGVAESKELAECLLVACQLAENDGKTELDPKKILRNKTINSTLKHICRYIPRDIRGSAYDSALKRATKRPPAKIEIPQVVQDLQERHRVLFSAPQALPESEQSESRDQIQRFPEIIPGNSLADCYRATVLQEEQQQLCNIRLRFLYIIFYRLKQEISPGSQYEYYCAANFIARTICDANHSNQPINVVEKRIRAWVGYGERYESLANDLGGLGALYILPDLGGESFWKRKLPKSADNQGRISIIQKLKQQDIPAEATRRGLHIIADDEVKSILDPLLKSVKEILNRGLSQANTISTAQNKSSQHSGNANTRERVSAAPDLTSEASQPLRHIHNASSKSSFQPSHKCTTHERLWISRATGITFNNAE
ncbi:hypothetical protein BO86DRAFT_121370 [Aspergillus japonicus CBS 114.51]|uniref:Uncharacterized protein n=1 Tax=Aspergillus japonicus CBS 114.51 TaxID=1448312 RepID=A0A8T8WYX2_ASPJA|nr:hypothetical protein BO86DRAFT_121370 [Aspergillus japonicus CBS 114.51]RAH80874.1 hypothetical protein BO86DRAFT_121370 [Aspergillus japonicus CBS 114.51]